MIMDRRGFTLFEMLVTGVLAGIAIAAVARYFPQIPTFFRRIQVQQIMHSESTTAMDTMIRFLREGKASTAHLCACNGDYCVNGVNPCVATAADPTQFSQIDFFTLDNHLRRFYFGVNNNPRCPNNDLCMDDIANPVIPYQGGVSTTLASNVASISFTAPTFPDFSIITIDLTMTSRIDSAGQTKTLIIPTQSVRMITNQ
jgi:prepilin-type N-terminal cleavage/methylation domain-containing protein